MTSAAGNSSFPRVFPQPGLSPHEDRQGEGRDGNARVIPKTLSRQSRSGERCVGKAGRQGGKEKRPGSGQGGGEAGPAGAETKRSKVRTERGLLEPYRRFLHNVLEPYGDCVTLTTGSGRVVVSHTYGLDRFVGGRERNMLGAAWRG